jgi:replicative DNA helicase
MIGARPKQGKSTLTNNIGLHVAGTLGIKVLNVDTEMSVEEQHARILAHLTGVRIKEIEQGWFVKDPEKRRKVREAAEWLKTIPYYYISVKDKSFDEQLAIMRRWITRNVPVDDEGVRPDCLVIYDYLQCNDSAEFKGDFKEYQILGFMMMHLLRLADRCDVSILSLLQLNRDGVDKESTAVASGSDRIIWKCANFTILKRKDEQEIAEDGQENGNAKLVPLIARHGEGLGLGDYISLKFDGRTSKMTEGMTRYQIRDAKGITTQEGFEVDGDADEIPFDR